MTKKPKTQKMTSPNAALPEEAKRSAEAERPVEAKLTAEVKDAKAEVQDPNVALVNQQLTNQIRGAVFYPEDATKKRVEQLGDRAVALVNTSKPGDTLEGMLISQMVATHNAAMRCYQHGLNTRDSDFQDRAYKHAAKFSLVYARQMEALDKHRGKGQQKVTVEHVHVGPGGQAIVGNVEASAKSPLEKKRPSQAPLEITRAPSVAFEIPQKVAAPVISTKTTR